MVSVIMLVPNRSLHDNEVSALIARRLQVAQKGNIPLSTEFIHHLRTSDSVWETWEVFDLSCGRKLTSWSEARKFE